MKPSNTPSFPNVVMWVILGGFYFLGPLGGLGS